MISIIGIVDVGLLQNILNQTFGSSIFIVGNSNLQTPPEYYIEYSDTTPSQDVDQALLISQEQVELCLNDTKLRLYQTIQIVANKQIASIEIPNFTDAEIQSASDWLQNQSLPVPACVSYLSLVKSITNVQSADYIVNSKTYYNDLINQAKTLQTQGQTAVMDSTDTYSAKIVAGNYMAQIKNIS